jgi:hypothetical protein
MIPAPRLLDMRIPCLPIFRRVPNEGTGVGVNQPPSSRLVNTTLVQARRFDLDMAFSPQVKLASYSCLIARGTAGLSRLPAVIIARSSLNHRTGQPGSLRPIWIVCRYLTVNGPLAIVFLIGRWRIVEADLRDPGYLDLSEPAYITLPEMEGRVRCQRCQSHRRTRIRPAIMSFTWSSLGEDDEVRGSGTSNLR